MILGDSPWPCRTSTRRTPVRRRSLSFDSAAFAREIDRRRPLHTRMDRAGARTRQRRSDAGTDPRHAAVGHNAGGTDRVQPSGGRGAASCISGTSGGRCGTAPGLPEPRRPSSRRRRRIISPCCARSHPRAARVTDKMPFNFLWAGLIHMAFPRATIIHCRRAAVDTALSIHQTHFHPSLAFPTGGEELVMYFRSYRLPWTIGGVCCRRIGSSRSIMWS